MPASGEKPYRVYRGGRTKGKVPLPARESEQRQRSTYRSGDGGPEVRRRPKAQWTWKRWTWVTLLALFVLLVVWSVAGYFSVRSGVSAANDRLAPGTTEVLQRQNSLLLTSGTNILLLGTDHSTNGQPGRSTNEHADSMM